MYTDLVIGDVHITLYYLFTYFGNVMMVLSSLLFLRDKKLGAVAEKACLRSVQRIPAEDLREQIFEKRIKIARVVELLLVACFLMGGGALCNFFWANNIVVTNVVANYFGTILFAPLVGFLAALIIRAEPLELCDLYTPTYAFSLIFYKLGCYCGGCCHGFEWAAGPYNAVLGQNQFPVQLLESLSAAAILAFLMIYRKRARPGTMMPVYTILYSGIRFCTEFLRGEENVLGPLKLYHLQCIGGVIVGAVELWLVLKYGARIQTFFKRLFYKSAEKPEMTRGEE